MKTLLFMGLLLLGACSSGPAPPPTPQANRAMACYMAQVFVEDRLKAPATADFQVCGEADVVEHADGSFTVTSYVDAQNGFGAQIRTRYVADVRWTGGDQWRLLDLQWLE